MSATPFLKSIRNLKAIIAIKINMKSTLKEITDAHDHLKDCAVAYHEAQLEEIDVKLKIQRAHYALTLAREEVRALQIN